MGSNHLNHQFGSEESKQHEKYRNNPALFMKQQWTGYDVESFKMSTIEPRGYQLKAIDSICKNKFNLLASSRQMGGSSMMSLYIAWYVLFNEKKQVVIMSNNSACAIRVLELIKAILLNYSVDGVFNFRKNVVKNNKTELELDNGCRIKALGQSADAGKGQVIDLLFVDNAAFIKNLSDIYMGLGMAIAVGDGKIILMSTPCDDSDFNLLALNAKENNDINYIEWSWDKLYTKEWYDQQCLQLGGNQKMIDTELDCIINYKEKSSKDKAINLRLDWTTYNKMKIKAGKLSISEYIRYLIDHDLS